MENFLLEASRGWLYARTEPWLCGALSVVLETYHLGSRLVFVRTHLASHHYSIGHAPA